MLKTFPSLLARLHDGRPKILSEARRVAELADWFDDTVELWRLEPRGRSGVLATPVDTPPGKGERTVDAGTPPMACIAVLAGKPLAGRLRRWWREAADEEMPLVSDVGGGPDTLLPLLLRRLAERTRVFAEAAALTQRALVHTRQDYELTRERFQELVCRLSLRPPEPPVLACEIAPAGSPLSLDAEGGVLVRQTLPVSTRGVTAVAFHVDARDAIAACRFRLRLIARESGRILGSWRQEGDLAPGWQRFELPQPVPGNQETALLELEISGPDDRPLALSLGAADALVDGETLIVAPRGSRRLERPLAFRIWTATVGSRFVRPTGFQWQEVDRIVSAKGSVAALPPELLVAAETLEGEDSLLRDEAQSRVIAALAPDSRVALWLPSVELGAADLLLVDLRTVTPPEGELQLAAWVVEPDRRPEGIEALESGSGSLAFSGWKAAPPRGALTVTMPVAGVADGRCGLVLAALRRGGAPEVPAAVEWQAIRVADPEEESTGGVSLAEPGEASRPREALEGTSRPAVPLLSDIAGSVDRMPPMWDTVRLTETRRLPSGYEHLALSVHELRTGERRWPEFRFKFAFWRGAPALEFRPFEPPPFRRWPEGERDRYGPLFRVPFGEKAAAEREARLGELDPEDRALVERLVDVLPDILESAFACAEPELDREVWLRRAASCRQALSRAREPEAA
ncbi:MAG TPA: hypothetical protein ENJ38_09685 [Rhodospirillales bacterium]|nr:hypothetical protein [Rhodospirillales bacterium]